MARKGSISIQIQAAYLIVLIVLTGCSSLGGGEGEEADKDARGVAIAVYQQTIVLKREVRQKIDAERLYYSGVLRTMATLRIDLAETDDFRSRLAEARALASDLAKSPGVVDSGAFSRRLAKNARDHSTAMDALREKERMQRQKTEQNLANLMVLNNRYTVLEQSLVSLSRPPEAQERGKELLLFVQAVGKHYQELKKEAADKTKTEQ